jgi:transmembrane sensor
LNVTAVLPRLDSLQALKLLARALPIRIEQRWPWWTVVRPR